MEARFSHHPVLLEAIVETFQSMAAGLFIDCTLGLGGHSEALLKANPNIELLGIDRDEMALAQAGARLAQFSSRVRTIQADYRELPSLLTELELTSIPVQGILADLGVSSLQLDMAARGFSFQNEGPLDMRMDQRQPKTAALLVNTLGETELADLIYQYGEEPASRRIARRIVSEREQKPIETTAELARIVAQAAGSRGHAGRGKRSRIHPATRTFQALRIAVNEELTALDRFVTDAVNALTSGGRLAIITFHSLEDRIIKNAFRFEAGQCQCPRNLPVCMCGTQSRVEILTKKPIIATDEEIENNPRARSAKLRICKKLL